MSGIGATWNLLSPCGGQLRLKGVPSRFIKPAKDRLSALQVRLEHMLQRLRALQDAAATARPTQLMPFLYVSGAVEASSLHVLRHLGVTHLLNATEDLLQPDESAGFEYAGKGPLL